MVYCSRTERLHARVCWVELVGASSSSTLLLLNGFWAFALLCFQLVATDQPHNNKPTNNTRSTRAAGLLLALFSYPLLSSSSSFPFWSVESCVCAFVRPLTIASAAHPDPLLLLLPLRDATPRGDKTEEKQTNNKKRHKHDNNVRNRRTGACARALRSGSSCNGACVAHCRGR